MNENKVQSYSTQESNSSVWSNPKIRKSLDSSCFIHMVNLLDNLMDGMSSFNITDVFSKWKILDKYNRLIRFIIITLENQQFLTQDGELFYKTQKFNEIKYRKNLPSSAQAPYQGIFEFLEYCFFHYLQVITGIVPAVSIIFPNGESEYLLKKLHQESVPYSNDDIFCDIIAQFFNHKSDNISEIIEVGAGHGLFSWTLLHKLNYIPHKYVFSDIGKTFLLDAKKIANNKGYTFMEFDILDISSPISSRYLSAYDAVIAYNVVHATSNISDTIKNLSTLIPVGGYLVLIELYHPYLWQHLVWGLLDGWWYFNDKYRINNPTVSVNQWENILQNWGYEILIKDPETKILQTSRDTALFIAQKRRTTYE